MQSFDIVTLRVFLAAARGGSIGAAARTEHIANSAVSRRISDLERDLGISLIRRTPVRCQPDPAGQVFVGHCEKILNQFAEVRADLKRFAEGGSGELRIGAIGSVLNGKLPGLIKFFQDAHPDIDISLTEITSADGIRQLREDLLDLAFVVDNIDTKGFDVRPFAGDAIWVIGAKGHPLFKGRKAGAPILFADTLDYEHLSFHEGGPLDELIATATQKAKRQPDRRISVVRFDALRHCVSAGLGLGFIRESAALPYLKLEDLNGAPLADKWADQHLITVSLKSMDVSPIVSKFLERLDASN